MELRLVGQFRLLDGLGIDRAPRGAKARAVLAMLVQVPEHRRSRRWLEARLWSDRGAEQASGSLRQVLVELRHVMGAEGHRVMADRETIWLEGVTLDHAADQAATALGREFLEGIGISDPRFVEWLAEERARLGGLALVPTRVWPKLSLTLRTPTLVEGDGQYLSHALASAIAGLVEEFAEVDIFAPAHAPAQVSVTDRGFSLTVDTLPGVGCINVLVSLAASVSGKVYWSRRATLGGDAATIIAGREFPQIVFQAADAAYGATATFPVRKPEEKWADGLTAVAVRAMFTFDRNRLREADQALEQAIDIQPSGRAYAWRGYLRQIMAVERTETDWPRLAAEADEYSRKAMELAGQNALVYALASQIRVMLDGDADIGMLLAQEAVTASPCNAFAHAALSGAHLRAGRYDQALEAARLGAEIAGRSSFAAWWQALAGLSAMAMGQYDEATAYYQAAHARSPGFRAPMRHLYFLYQATGKTERAFRILGLLQRVEPDFSLARVRDDVTYPAATLRRSDLIGRAARYV